MKDIWCCGQAMYQEIDRDNKLISICKICDKRIVVKLNLGHGNQLNIENFNTN